MQLATRFARHAHAIRSESPLSDDAIRSVAPSIFAEEAHGSRSERYAYIPTSHVLTALRKEGFQPFMACQTRCRDEFDLWIFPQKRTFSTLLHGHEAFSIPRQACAF